MSLLAINLHPSSSINCAVYGNFTAPKQQEIAVARGNHLDLLRPDENGHMITVCSTPAFALIRSLITFRLTGANRDYLVVGSDSGKISIVEYDSSTHNWKVVHCEVFGKTGCRRIVPGQYLAADPKGRSILIGSVEKQRFAYVMNRDSTNKLTISSPLEAHRPDSILFSVIGIDVGYDNPIYAMIEMEYTEVDQDPTGEALQTIEKKLSYYELDLGLNHIVRKWSEPISRNASFLLAVPGGDTAPSGVLICGENWVSYKHQGHPEIRAALPRRHDIPSNKGVLITTGILHKQKELFFYLLQSEFGDLYKVTLELDPENPKIVQDLHVIVFDTIQLSNSLCITKNGFLFTASEASNHQFFQFQGIDDPLAVRASKVSDEMNEELGDDALSAGKVAPVFRARNKLRNLALIDEIPSLAPITDMLMEDFFNENACQYLALCGRNHRSTLRILRKGVTVNEIAVSQLPNRPLAVWTIKKSQSDEYDTYIVVSSTSSTLVLSIGENVEEITDSGFKTDTSTLQVVLLEDNAMLQIHSQGIRHIRPDKSMSEWKHPSRRAIQYASANSRQVAITTSGGEITYFELDEAGQLIEMGTTDLGKDISCLDVGVVPEDRVRSSFLAVGFWDNTAQLLNLDPSDILGKLPAIPLDSRPTSVCLTELVKEVSKESKTYGGGSKSENKGGSQAMEQVKTLYFYIGLEKGVLVRCTVDKTTGDLSDKRKKFLGVKPIRLCRANVQRQPAVLALSSRPWLLYYQQNKYHQDPLTYESLEYATDFTSELCPNGMVAVTENSLRILTIETLGQTFQQTAIPLQYTPRKIVRLPESNEVVVIESDAQEFPVAEREAVAARASQEFQAQHAGQEMETDTTEGEEETTESVTIAGPKPPTDGSWGSIVRIVDVTTGLTKSQLALAENEAAVSLCTCQFSQHSEETFLIVGTVRGWVFSPRRFQAAYLHVYRLIDGQFSLLHKTEVEDIPAVVTDFQGRLLAGIGHHLRLYDLGKKKLLKKTETKSMPSQVVRLQCIGDRIYAGDLTQSVILVRYRKQENTLTVIADDTLPRYITCLTILDYNTVACGDKFGNIFVLRLPESANDDITSSVNASNTAGQVNLWDHTLLHGAPNKFELLHHYYLGEIPMYIGRPAVKIQGNQDILLVATINGGIFAFVPARTKQESTFFQHLEMFMRQEFVNICQRDHLSYRSYYHPVKTVIDIELCEKFMELNFTKQSEFGESVDCTPAEVIKRLEEISDLS